MRYQHSSGVERGSIHLSGRTKAEIEGGTFKVPSEYDEDPAVHQRLIDAGNVPDDPSALPDGVEYDPSGESESGSESDSDDGDDESPSEERTGAVTSEALREDADGDESEPSDEAEEESPDLSEADLDDLDRSELYALGSDLDLGWEWSGEDAVSTEEMRSELKELA